MRTKLNAWFALGSITILAAWVALKHIVGVSDRYLPAPGAVVQSVAELEPSIWVHAAYSCVRLAVGFVLGLSLGILAALAMARSSAVESFLIPIFQPLRAVPAAAVVPFFLLWFGFSEWGRYLLVVTAIAFNMAIASHQILRHTPPQHNAFFKSFGLAPGRLTWSYCLPRIAEGIVPTVRFSLVVAIGAVTVSELLGSQVGLGYLIQTSRSTFSLDVLMLAIILLGLLSALADWAAVRLWTILTYWRD